MPYLTFTALRYISAGYSYLMFQEAVSGPAFEVVEAWQEAYRLFRGGVSW